MTLDRKNNTRQLNNSNKAISARDGILVMFIVTKIYYRNLHNKDNWKRAYIV